MTPTVLVVEDEADHLAAVRLTLRLAGYAVAEARTGEAALASLRQSIPQAVVLDVRLPGIEGVEVLATIRASARLRDLPVVLISAHAGADAYDRVLADPCSRFIRKPFHPDELLDELGAVIGRTPLRISS